MRVKLLLFLFLSGLCSIAFAEDLRGDTISIGSFLMKLDFTNFSGQILKGDATVGITARMNGVTAIHLDLLELTVDSVKVNTSTSTFSYNDSVLNISLPTLNTGDSATLEIFYHGHPIQIPGDFGGFYWTTTFAYNIGVSFKSNPHNFGKCWFPCFDNFSERSYHEYYVTTLNTQKAFCNGLLIDSTTADSTITWHWKLAENIPTYLASVTISDFMTLYDTVQGMNGTIPILRAVHAGDTAQIAIQMKHLHQAFHNLENHWGPFRWERVGYCLVPFNAGAMEHATNISFSQYFIDPAVPQFYTLGEQKMAHELSHHWFGDLVTTDSSAEMWLNEGWANFNEYLFFENIYSPDSAKKAWRNNHKTVVQLVAEQDGGYWPVAGVKNTLTYGNTVYEKGADMVHTLRGYMGDSLFFHCIQQYLDYYAWNNGSTQKMSDFLSQCSGIDMSYFFNDWIWAPGFPHFSIENKEIQSNGNNYTVNFQIRQRLKHAPALYTNVPIKVSYFNWDMTRTVETVMVSGECTSHSTTLAYQPAYIAVDFDEDLQDAVSDEWQTIKDTGNYTFNIGLMNLHVNSIHADSVMFREEHNWIPADAMYHPVPGLHLDNRRYWTIGGVFDSTFSATGTIAYNGQAGAYLDSGFISNSEDSLVLMYRPNQDADWMPADSFFVNVQGSTIDKVGQIIIYNLKAGEYAIGIHNSHLPTDTNTRAFCPAPLGIAQIEDDRYFQIFPNPALTAATVTFMPDVFAKLEICDLPGRTLLTQKISASQNSTNIKLSNLAAGIYLVTLTDTSGNHISKKLIKQ
jgi:hypothetical protein